MIKKLLSIYLIAGSLFISAQQSYYNDVDLTKSGIALKDELATKITATHTNFLSYTPGVWEASKATDFNPDNANEVLLIYGYSDSGQTARTRGINDNGGASNDWNREHVFPRSLGDPNLGRVGPGADAHHLRPADPAQNSDRSNFPFAESEGLTTSGKVNDGWFPGDEWKGDVARMMMYMYVRYGDQCLPSTVGVGSKLNTPDEMIDLFLKWNAEDPVSQFEDNRNTYHGNTANAYAQGNRNPFIDNPNLATQIWGGPAAEDRWATASVNDVTALSKVLIYPNPSFSGNITIKGNPEAVSRIRIFSILGKEIYTKSNPEFKSQEFKITGLKSGIYLLQLSNKNKSITKKLVIR
ncbi:endonuclease [Tenacibaculum amylolyticum]|uniref:endonuclease n=1 Tax=Tenacibaculum amylolyticum TaxID=104269 RepID=UPI0038961717